MPTILSLNQSWLFQQNPETLQPPFSAAGMPVDIPHCWNAIDGQSGDGYFRGCCVYYKALCIPAGASHYFLEFQGANSVCRIYLNDQFLGEHRGGYSTFRFDISKLCTPGGEDRLTVLVDNSETEDVSPLGGDFTIFGGLYRDVNLVMTGNAHFDLMYYGTSGVLLTPTVDDSGKGLLKIEAHICGPVKSVEYTLLAPDGTVAAQRQSTAEHLVLEVPSPLLWNGKQFPNLYTLTAKLTGADGETDVVTHKVGFRSFRVDPNTGFWLNGKQMPLRGVARHQDRQDLGNALALEHWEEDMAILEELGANAVRLSHYQHPQVSYDLCDTHGLVVWAEIPMLQMEDKPALVENAKQQLRELILQNIHHPSICFWGLQNEIAIAGETLSMYRHIEELNALAHELDDSRLTTSANLYCVKNESPLNSIPDIVAYNLYFGWYYGKMEEYADFISKFRTDNPNICLGFSEYGVDCNLGLHADDPKLKDYSEEFQALFHQTVYPLIDQPFVWGTFVWNLFDFGSAHRNEGKTKGKNAKGLVSYDRKTKKDSFYYYKARWSQEPFVHLNSRRFADRATATVTATVYSNQNNVELLVNGEVVGTQEGGPVFIFENVPLIPGENTVTVRSGAVTDTVIWNRVETPNPDYIYVDPNPGYNVSNWFTLEQSEEDLFPTDRYSIMDTFGELMANQEVKELLETELPDIMGSPMISKAKAFTLFKMLNRMSGTYPDEVAKELNSKLNQIHKV